MEVGQSKIGALEPFLEQHRDELWGQAIWLWRNGYRPNVPRDLKPYQSDHNEQFERGDEQVQEAYNHAVRSGAIQMDKPFTLSQLAVQMSLADNLESFQRGRKEEQHRIRNVLEANGWEHRPGRRSPGAAKERLWWPPIREGKLTCQ